MATAVYQAASIYSKRALLLGLIANLLIQGPMADGCPILNEATYGLLWKVLLQEKASQKGSGLPPEVMELAELALEEGHG